MKDEEVLNSNLQPIGTHDPPQVRSPYELLVDQNKKLGKFATDTFRGMKSALNHEIQLPSKERLLSSLALTPHTAAQSDHVKISALKQMVRKSHEVLATARGVFPMTLFPDKITLDRTKVTIVKRDFFWTSNVVSIRIEDVLNVTCGTGPLFGSITVSSRVMNSIDHYEVNFLWRNEAIYLKSIIQGYVIAKHNKIDTANLSRQEMLETLSELGRDSDTR